MVKKLFNGQNIVQWISIISIVAIATIGAVYGYGSLTAQVESCKERADHFEVELDDKTSNARFDDLREDVKDIKKMLNVLLRRTKDQ